MGEWGVVVRIYTDEKIEIFAIEDRFVVKCKKPFEMKVFNEIIANYPRLQVGNFLAIKEALIKATNEEITVGSYKPLIELEVSKDAMAAYVKLNMTKTEYNGTADQIPSLIVALLQSEEIKFGIMADVINGPIEPMKRIQVAAGKAPIPGVDAKIKYFSFSEKKPEIRTDGGVDHFEIHLIDPVEIGDWLGEKTPSTPGINGVTVKNEEVPAKPGRDFALKYEKETVQHQQHSDGRETIKARITGAATIRNQCMAVDNHLIISGNVDYSTGNIDFDGFVTVKGIVEDLFSIRATKDVAVLGDMGIGAVSLIESREGSIFIRGGINGKGQAKLVAKKNVYLKYCSEATVEAQGAVQIGVYAYDSQISASKVEMLKSSSKIVGGLMVAKHQVVSGIIGNQFERETDVRVLGFDRVQLKMEMDNVNAYYLGVIDRAGKIKRQLDVFQLNIEKLDQKAVNTYHLMQQEFDKIVVEISNIKESLAQMEEVLRIRGDGEIKILSQIHPKSALEIKNHKKRINNVVTGSFYVKDNNLHHTSI